MEKTKVAVIGSGPAGLTAAIYSARADLKTVVFEGNEPGGQLITTTTIENFPGFPEGINGPDLMENMRQQATRFGAQLVQEYVTDVDLQKRPFTITFGEHQQLLADSIIIASGASARWMGLPAEGTLRGRGVSSCATCDAFFYRNKRVAVIGGGDTAMEDALHLTRFASQVIIIHRRDSLRASKYMQQRAFENPKITWRLNSVVTDIIGSEEKGVTSIQVMDVQSKQTTTIELDGVFVAIGHHPNTEFLKGQLPLDANGFIKADFGSLSTNIPGVFVAGDVIDPKYRQAITAAGMGCMASLELQKFLELNDNP